jgi:Zn-dependent peptidase ImmA (M78 family)
MAAGRGVDAARALRAQLGEREAPLDILALVERRGLGVVIADLGERLAGVYVRRGARGAILLHGRQPAPRQRFTLAHELGHHVLGHAASQDTPETLARASDQREVGANAFAGELLVPRAAAAAAVAAQGGPVTTELVVRLAAAYGVSAPAALIRLRELGALRERARRVRIEREIAAGEHTGLAARLGLRDLDDTLARERAPLPRLPGGGGLLGPYARGEIGAARVAAALRCDRAVLERVMREAGLAPPDC